MTTTDRADEVNSASDWTRQLLRTSGRRDALHRPLARNADQQASQLDHFSNQKSTLNLELRAAFAAGTAALARISKAGGS